MCSDKHDLLQADLRNIYKQAGAELGQAQLKLGLDFTLIFFKFGSSRFGLVHLVW